MRQQPIPEAVAHKIYDVLVEHLGVREFPDEHLGMDSNRYSFVRYATEGSWTEYRIGVPGPGGKIRFQNGRWFVNYYPENKTVERDALCDKTNIELDKLWEEHFGQPPRRYGGSPRAVSPLNPLD